MFTYSKGKGMRRLPGSAVVIDYHDGGRVAGRLAAIAHEQERQDERIGSLEKQVATNTGDPAASFDLLWPLDVDDPDACLLLRYINLRPNGQCAPDPDGIHSCAKDFNTVESITTSTKPSAARSTSSRNSPGTRRTAGI